MDRVEFAQDSKVKLRIYRNGFMAGASSALGSAFVRTIPARPLVKRSYGSLEADAQAITVDGERLLIHFKAYQP